MGFFSKLFAAAPAPDPSLGRRELVRVALRDTLNFHGIPSTWLGAETLASTSRAGLKGIHCRILIKQWVPDLLLYSVALQQSFTGRLIDSDPKAGTWLMGISWQFALPDESVCPAMNQRSWTTAAQAPATPAHLDADAAVVPVRQASPAPVVNNAKVDLEALFAARDQELKRLAQGQQSKTAMEKTQTMFRRTEPAPLD